ncbi:MAG: DUF3108 domain-containing protein [Gammaproteobacteria bacterium]
MKPEITVEKTLMPVNSEPSPRKMQSKSRNPAGAIATPLLFAAILAAPGAFSAPAPPITTAAASLPATLAIPAFHMTYRVLRGSLHIGTAQYTLERNGRSWYFHSEAHATGLAGIFFHSTFRESTRFTIADRLIRPFAYAYSDSGDKSHDETIRFDWANGKALDTQNGKTKTPALAPGRLDRLSAQLAISRRLAAGVPVTVPYHIIKGGEVDTYHLVRKKNETITTPAGKFETVLVVRDNPGSKRTTRFWLAPKYAWLPVKMQHVSPGDATYSFILEKLQWLATKSKPQ